MATAMELERKLIETSDWPCAPKAAYELALEESKQGVPTGIAYHPTEGWFVLQTSGQGPYIIWQEKQA
jgi:hypothetical protein